MNYSNSKITTSTHIDLYTGMLFPRMIEEKMLILLRQGKISKWFSGIGQEAISVGVTKALNDDEYILPMHRNLGVFTSRKIPLHRLFSQWQGKSNGFTKGRDRSFHFGTNEYNIVGMISHLGPQMGVADGIALNNLISKNKKMSINEIQLQSSLKTSFLNFVLTNLEIKQFIEPKIGNFYKIKF